MSKEAIEWVRGLGDHDFRETKVLLSTLKATLFTLAMAHDAETGICNPSIKALSPHSGDGVWVVLSFLNELERIGLLSIERGDEGKRNKYTFLGMWSDSNVVSIRHAVRRQGGKARG